MCHSICVLQPIKWLGRTNDLGRGAYFQVGGPYMKSVSYSDVAIMTERKAACPLSRSNQERRGFAFMIYNGTGYMHDPRVVSVWGGQGAWGRGEEAMALLSLMPPTSTGYEDDAHGPPSCVSETV